MNRTTERKDITDIANRLLVTYEKQELSKELGMSRPTLNTRLEDHRWKTLEITQIERLHAKLT